MLSVHRWLALGARRGYSTHAKAPTVRQLAAIHRQGKKLVMSTAYDYPTAVVCERAEVDLVLVGDSLAMTALGYPSTRSVTVDEMLHHCRAVARGSPHRFKIGDLPFGSYEVDAGQAVRTALRFIAEGRMDAVKLEGGRTIAESVRRIVDAGVPVMGHVGLLPQRASSTTGFAVCGKTAEGAEAVLEDALALQDAGCFAVVIEAVPSQVAERITERLDIPTIGIGAGPHCSGQVLVINDLLGVFDGFRPKFVKRYADLNTQMISAVSTYASEVRSGSFPLPEHEYSGLSPSVLKDFHARTQCPPPNNNNPSAHTTPAAVSPSSSSTSTPRRGIHTSARAHFTNSSQGTPSSSLRVAILGSGAVGSFVASCLTRSSTTATELLLVDGWHDHVVQMRERGLTRTVQMTDDTSEPACVTESGPLNTQKNSAGMHHSLVLHTSEFDARVSALSPPRLPPVDVIVVACKGNETQAMAERAAALSDEHTAVISLQNGLGHMKTLSDAVERGAVSGAVASFGAFLSAPGTLTVSMSARSEVTFGRAAHASTAKSERALVQLCEALRSQLPSTQIVSAAQLEQRQWAKLLVNALINPLTALFRMKNGALARAYEHNSLMAQVMRSVAQESALVAEHALGVPVTGAQVLDNAMQVLQTTEHNTSSMLADVLRVDKHATLPASHHTEIEFITGALVSHARRVGLSVPVNQRILQAVCSRRVLQSPEDLLRDPILL